MKIYLHIPTGHQTDGRITSVSYWIHKALMMLGRQKCIHSWAIST